MTKIGRKFQQHAARKPRVWGPLGRTNADKNKQALDAVEEFLEDPGPWKLHRSTGPLGTHWRKRLLDGRGIALHQHTKEFLTFLDP